MIASSTALVADSLVAIRSRTMGALSADGDDAMSQLEIENERHPSIGHRIDNFVVTARFVVW